MESSATTWMNGSNGRGLWEAEAADATAAARGFFPDFSWQTNDKLNLVGGLEHFLAFHLVEKKNTKWLWYFLEGLRPQASDVWSNIKTKKDRKDLGDDFRFFGLLPHSTLAGFKCSSSHLLGSVPHLTMEHGRFQRWNGPSIVCNLWTLGLLQVILSPRTYWPWQKKANMNCCGCRKSRTSCKRWFITWFNLIYRVSTIRLLVQDFFHHPHLWIHE